jgi:hypothetical protein
MRFLAFFLLALLFLPELTASARAKLAGVAAGDAAYERSCRLNYAAFESGTAERRNADRVAYDKETRIAARHARFEKVGDADNAHFIPMAIKANAGEPTPAKLFFFSENAVLKELNDKVVMDKDLVTALTNLRKDLEHFHLALDPELGPHIVARYSDFKVLQIGLDTNDPALVAKLHKKLAAINGRYGDYLADIAEKRGWSEKGNGLAQYSQRWFHAGYGASPDEAALAARDSRTAPLVNGAPQLRSIAQARPGLEQAARNTGRYQAWAAKRFANVDGMLVDAGQGRKVLSAEAIEAMKKATPLSPGAEGYREAVRKVLKARFGADVSAKEADALKNYLALADRFSAPLLLEKRVVIDMSQPASAVISADFKGQNARNLEQTLMALARSEGEPFPVRIKEVRRGETIATEKLELLKTRYQRALSATVPNLEGQFSGDDGMGFLTKAFSDDDKLRFVRNWQKEGGGLGDLRLTFEEFRYYDTGANIPGDARSRLVVEAESVEKKLREKLLGPLNRRELNDTKILVSLEGAEKGPGRVNLLLLNGEGEKKGVAETARRLTEALGFTVGSVRMRAP